MQNPFRTKLAVNIIVVFVLALLLFSILTSYIGYKEFTAVLDDRYADNGYRIGEITAQIVDRDRMDQYLTKEGRKTKEYKAAMESIQKLANHMDVTFIYLIQPDPTDYQHITFVFSVMNDKADFDHFEPGHVRETSSDEYAQKYRRIMENGSAGESVFRDKWVSDTGAHVTAMVPLSNSQGEVIGIICVQRQMDALNASRRRFLQTVFLTALLVMLLISLLYSWILNRKVIRPIRTISEETVRFSRENVLPQKLLQEKVRTKNEVGLLAMHVDKMELAILQYTENLKTLTSERDRIETELNVASSIQKAILPNVFPPFPERDEFQLYATMNPAKEVGGDFYDFFFLDDDRLALVIADVSGKGVPAALFMMICKIILKNAATQGGTPAEILTKVNRQISEGNQTNMFVTAWLGILDVTNGVLTTANAGHEYPAICRADGTFELFKDKHGFVIGGISGMQYKDETLTLQPGDTLFVYTDGVTEASNASEELFGTDRMVQVLNQSPHADPEELLDILMTDLRTFSGDTEQADDITMMALQYRGHKNHLGSLRLEANVENLETVTGWLEDRMALLNAPAKATMQLTLAAEEVFVNIAKYAYAPGTGYVILRANYDPEENQILLTFLDNGVSYDPLLKEDPDTTLSADEREIGGLGIFLVKKNTDDAIYQRVNDRNILTLKKTLSKAE